MSVNQNNLITITLSTHSSRSAEITISGDIEDTAGNTLSLSNELVRNETQFFESAPSPATVSVVNFVQNNAQNEVGFIQILGYGFQQFLDIANGATNETDIKEQFDFSKLNFYLDVDNTETIVDLLLTDVLKANILSDGEIRIYLSETLLTQLYSENTFGDDTNGIIAEAGYLSHVTGVANRQAINLEYGQFQEMSFTYVLGSLETAPDAYVKSITLLGTGSYSGNQILVEGADIVVGGAGNIALTNIPSHINSILSVQTEGNLTIGSWAGDLENKIITQSDIPSLSTGQDESQGTIIVKALADSFALGAVVTGIELHGDGITLETDGTLANFAFGNGDQLLKVNGLPMANGELSVSGFDSMTDDIDLTALGGIFATEGLTDRLASTSFKSYAGALEAGNIDADDRILFDSTTGVVYYDADGSGAGSESVILFILTGQTVLNNPTAITAEDFRVAVA